MGPNFMTNYIEIAAAILFGIGFMDLFLHKNLIKKIIGFNIMDTAVYLFLAVKGYVTGLKAPIVTEGASAAGYINPVPSGLVLTGIVVSVSVTALMLSLTVLMYYNFHTLNMDEILLKMREKENR